MVILPDAGSAASAATNVIVKAAKDSFAPVPVAVDLLKRFLRPAVRPRQETTADRSANVTIIRITPAKLVGYVGQPMHFSAIGSNANGLIIQGAQFSWASSNDSKLQIDDTGQARLLAPGLAWVKVATANASARVPVLIRPGRRPAQSDNEWKADQDQLRPDGTVVATQGTSTDGLLGALAERLMPTAHAQNMGSCSDFPYDELWSEPRNLVGSPRNRATAASAIGAILPEGSNFEFSVPLYGLAGRVLSTGIAFKYNSRIWSRHGSAVTLDAINTWPYLGFTLSFGRIVTYGPAAATKFILVDSDGTRHYLGSGAISVAGTYQTDDGSHITYVGDGVYGGTLYYNNGLRKSVTITNNRLLVTMINDANGNYLNIQYKNLSPYSSSQSYQALDSVTDTLGRVVQFLYDNNDNLISVEVPGYSGTAQNPVTTTVARFDYTTATPSSSFSGLTVENVSSSCQARLLSHVYFPATSTGYKFTYSAYGMITTVSLRKEMSYNGSTGAISDGNEKAYASFNYPAAAASLTDAPSFSQWTQSPAATTGGTATYSVATSSDSGAKVFTITNPDATTLTLMRSDVSGTAYGLLTQTEVKTSGGASTAKTVISYTTDGGGSPQVANLVSYDDATPTANQTKVDYDYDGYGNVTNVREYGYQQGSTWVVRRRTRNVYKTDSSYVNAYLRNLVVETDTYDAQADTNDANDVLLAKTTYTYDDYNATGGIENYGNTGYQIGHAPSYDVSYTLRGNVTSVTQWYDLANNLSIIHLRKLDIFGTPIKEQLSCCNQEAINTNDANGYLMPVTVVKGDPSGTTLTTAYGADFNTSLLMSVTGPDGLTTAVSSRDAALRPTQISLPTGAMQTVSYNDSTLSVSGAQTYDDGGTQKTITTTTDYDGWGRVIHQTSPFGGQVNTNYNQMGQVASVSNPFAVGGSPAYWTNYAYDALGRETMETLPDGQTVQTNYNGNSVIVIDAVNRKVQRLTDGLGRLVTVNEQDASGNLTQATNYSYNYLNNLTQVDQGGQLRKFKYDALSRLIYESIPEQTTTINDGSGTYWTKKYTYTDFNAVATRQDARGIVTSYAYDSLNRLQQITYNSVSGVATAPMVTYYYDSGNYGAAPGKLVSVVLGGEYDEQYTYDSAMRPASTIRRTYQPSPRTYTTSYGYNAAGQATQLTHASGLVVAITHDGNGRFSGLQNAATQVSYLGSIGYNVAGQMTGDMLGNGVTEQFGYDPARMQMTSQKAGTTSPYTNRMDLTYGYTATASGQLGVGTTAGNAGQLLSVSGTISGATESASYTYDDSGRLVTSSQTSNGSTAQRRFVYDRWGNRTGVWDATSGGTQIQSLSIQTANYPKPTGPPTNRIIAVTTGGNPASYSYDANGNVTNDGSHSYTYDSENRLVSVDGGATASYAYDHQNRRYKKTAGGSVTNYIWEGTQVIAEHNASTGAALADYVYQGSRMIAKVAGGATTYFLSDQLSARLTLDASGAVTGRQAHLPYGEGFAGSGTQQKQRFTGYERDTETGTDYAMRRQYGSAAGRFLQVDPIPPRKDAPTAIGSIGDPQSLNRYNYSRNDAINLKDPTGCTTCGGHLVMDEYDAENELIDMNYAGYYSVPCANAGTNDEEAFPSAEPPCPDYIRNFFSLVNQFKNMAQSLGTDVKFLLALSSWESGWLGEHAQELHNLFGTTHAGGNDIEYPSYQAAIDDWIRMYSSYVSNTSTIDQFIQGLKDAHYNTKEQYYVHIEKQVSVLEKFAGNCGIDLTLPPNPNSGS